MSRFTPRRWFALGLAALIVPLTACGTAGTPAGALAAYRKAVAAGSDYVVGPLGRDEVDALFAQCHATTGYRLNVDLDAKTITRPDGKVIPFDVDPFRRECLLNGWDDIGLTLRHADKIRDFEAKRRIAQPWLFA